MQWVTDLVEASQAQLNNLLTSRGPIDAAKDFLTESVAQRIRDEACAQAYQLLAQAHRSVIRTIIWQNALLIISILPVYILHSAIPFYAAYAFVASYSICAVAKTWPFVLRLLRSRSVTHTLSTEVQNAINKELTQRQLHERKAVEWLAGDLKKIADDVARKLRPDVMAAVSNMAITLLLAFIAFRLFAIPLLEHRALQ
jgi:hypothetical protein